LQTTTDMFLRTKSNELISLVDVARIYSVEHETGGQTIVAVLRGSGVQVELCRSYTIERLTRALDPVSSGR
jgi:hypothetical protein